MGPPEVRVASCPPGVRPLPSSWPPPLDPWSLQRLDVLVRRAPVLLFCAGLLILSAGCGDGESAVTNTVPLESTPTSTGVTGSTSAPTTAATQDPALLPTVSGGFGEQPTVEVPAVAPPGELVTQVLEEGDGDVVEKGDLLVANYAGHLWDTEKVFDSSFDQGEPAGFPIGVGGVIPGWDEALVGKNVGSRVLLVIPPDKGYGDQGSGDGSIPGGATLVFVVDLVGSYGPDQSASGTPVSGLPAGLPEVSSGGSDAAPTLSFPAGVRPPRGDIEATVLIEGDGAPIEKGQSLVAQIIQASYETEEVVNSTYESQPQVIDPAQVPGLAEALAGQQVGTRVLVQVPAEQTGSDAVAAVVDVIGAF